MEKPDTENMTVHQWITNLGKTQEQIARRLNVSLTTVNSWFNRRQMPKADNFFALCRELQLTPIQLGKMLGIDVDNVPS